MSAIRRYVRAVAMTWLLCQAASLSAFVPEHCCISHAAEAAAKKHSEDSDHSAHAAHAAPAAATESCHEAPPAEPKEGDVCPMHEGTQQRGHDCCVMTNACDGPGTHLASLLQFVGVLEAPQSAPLTIEATNTHASPAPPPLVRVSTPDAPPPKR